jgi:hypothetical protein
VAAVKAPAPSTPERLRSVELPPDADHALVCRTLEAIRDEDLAPAVLAEKHERRAVLCKQFADKLPFMPEITIERDRLRAEILAQAKWDSVRAQFHREGTRERQPFQHFFKQVKIIVLWRSGCGGRVWPLKGNPFVPFYRVAHEIVFGTKPPSLKQIERIVRRARKDVPFLIAEVPEK